MQGYSSVGRATVSKTVGRGFKSLCPCQKVNVMNELEGIRYSVELTKNATRQWTAEEAEAYRVEVVRKVLSGEIKLEIIPDNDLDEY